MAAKREFFFKAAERRALEGGGPARGAPDPPSCVSAAGMDSLEQAAGVWKHRATSAFRCGDFYRAQMCYSRELDCLPEGDAERRGVAHSNLSACLAKVQHFEGALQEAKKATELRPTWGRAWGRLGAAAALAEGSDAAEARTAWFKAVEVEPSAAHVEGLASAYEGDSAGDTTHQHKEKGAEAMRVQEYGTAIAHFTVAIAALPALAKPIKSDDDHALLRAVLHSNRCAAFSKSKLWALGVVDGKKAVEYKGDYAKAYCRLGVAQLGCRLNEDAYKSFAKALYHEDAMQLAKRGREVCLGLLPHWDSQKSHWRSTKFSRDAGRPLGVTKVYAVSDVHYDQTGREDWAHSIHPTKFLDDVLIIAGNIADSFRAVERALTNLRTKFKRIFYLPGNHEMWVNKLEEKNHPDSLCKLWSIMEMCDRLDIEVFPAAICKGVYVVPMHSWYNAHFDIKDPFPDPKSEADKYVRFPIDAQQQVWRYMLALNKAHLDRKYEGTVISFSHFVPRPGLPVWREPGIMKVSGCAELDDQIRQVGSTCHIYGHTYFKYNQTHDGVTYINRPLEIVGEGSREPLVCVFNGHHLCHELTTV